MKKATKGFFKSYSVAPGEGIISYAALILLGLIFAQAHRDPFSHAVFVFVVVFPLISVVCLLLSVSSVRAFVANNSVSVARNGKVRFCVTVKNSGIFPVNVILETYFPEQGGLRGLACVRKKVCLMPFSETLVEAELICGRIGVYDVGVKGIVCHDYMHVLRVKKSADASLTLYVTPKQLPPIGTFESSGNDSDSSIRLFSEHPSENYSDLREYRAGDGMKNIHWKLSAKHEELQVKRYSKEESKTLLVKCSSGFAMPRGISENDRCEIEDRIIEEAFSVLSYALSEKISGEITVELDNSFLCVPFGEGDDPGDVALRLSSINTALNHQDDRSDFDAQNTVYVIPFLEKEQLQSVLDKVNRTASGNVFVIVCDVKDIVGKYSFFYGHDVETFVCALSKNGIPCLYLKRGGTE